MTQLFSTRPGHAIAVNDNNAPLELNLTNWGGDRQSDTCKGFTARRCILLGMRISEQGNYQFLHSLKNVIHVDTFGDRIGEMTLSGLAFPGDCTNEQAESGIAGLRDYYKAHRLYQHRNPLAVQLGKASFLAFLTSVLIDIQDARAGITQFNLQLFVQPNDTAAESVTSQDNND